MYGLLLKPNVHFQKLWNENFSQSILSLGNQLIKNKDNIKILEAVRECFENIIKEEKERKKGNNKKAKKKQKTSLKNFIAKIFEDLPEQEELKLILENINLEYKNFLSSKSKSQENKQELKSDFIKLNELIKNFGNDNLDLIDNFLYFFIEEYCKIMQSTIYNLTDELSVVKEDYDEIEYKKHRKVTINFATTQIDIISDILTNYEKLSKRQKDEILQGLTNIRYQYLSFTAVQDLLRLKNISVFSEEVFFEYLIQTIPKLNYSFKTQDLFMIKIIHNIDHEILDEKTKTNYFYNILECNLAKNPNLVYILINDPELFKKDDYQKKLLIKISKIYNLINDNENYNKQWVEFYKRLNPDHLIEAKIKLEKLRLLKEFFKEYKELDFIIKILLEQKKEREKELNNKFIQSTMLNNVMIVEIKTFLYCTDKSNNNDKKYKLLYARIAKKTLELAQEIYIHNIKGSDRIYFKSREAYETIKLFTIGNLEERLKVETLKTLFEKKLEEKLAEITNILQNLEATNIYTSPEYNFLQRKPTQQEEIEAEEYSQKLSLQQDEEEKRQREEERQKQESKQQEDVQIIPEEEIEEKPLEPLTDLENILFKNFVRTLEKETLNYELIRAARNFLFFGNENLIENIELRVKNHFKNDEKKLEIANLAIEKAFSELFPAPYETAKPYNPNFDKNRLFLFYNVINSDKINEKNLKIILENLISNANDAQNISQLIYQIIAHQIASPDKKKNAIIIYENVIEALEKAEQPFKTLEIIKSDFMFEMANCYFSEAKKSPADFVNLKKAIKYIANCLENLTQATNLDSAEIRQASQQDIINEEVNILDNRIVKRLEFCCELYSNIEAKIKEVQSKIDQNIKIQTEQRAKAKERLGERWIKPASSEPKTASPAAQRFTEAKNAKRNLEDFKKTIRPDFAKICKIKEENPILEEKLNPNLDFELSENTTPSNRPRQLTIQHYLPEELGRGAQN